MEDKVKVKIKPLHNIGGVGKAGDVVWMTPEEAEGYVRDGYVEYVKEVSGSTFQVSGDGASTASGVPLSAQREDITEEDHAIMKPEVKRAKKVVRKK